jgi:SSS family solute:Na+ symporter
MGIVDIIVFVAFVAAVLFVGLWKSKGEDTHGETGAEDYFLAGRGLTWWLIGFSLIAANISAEQFVGMSGQGAGFEGLSVSSWEWIAAITLVVVAFVLLPYFLRSGITTIPEFLEVRYNHWARLVMTLSMTVILIGVSLIGVIYAGAIAMTKLFSEMGTDITLPAACWILGGLAAAYVAVGGLKACAWADLLQGSALIVGAGIITYFAFQKLGITDVSSLVDATGAAAAADVGAGSMEKFSALNETAMHMDTPAMPWPVLIIGIWIPNFYYWGLNQYITQRILGSASLAEGQKGLVLAGFLKLLVPFIIVIPGIIAFNLFSGEMADGANLDAGGNVFAPYELAQDNPNNNKIFELDAKYGTTHPEIAEQITIFNAATVARVGEENVVKSPINAYKYDDAMGLLISKLIPKNKGLLGFVFAALLGAIISSLAAVLNAASTLFTMDVYQRYIRPEAKQFEFVTVGRVCIGVFVVIGCLVAPKLVEFKSIFAFIQSIQGYVSTGILAVFIYGLINRTSGRWAGVIGIVANAGIYHYMLKAHAEMHFLYSMSVCLGVVLAILVVYGLIFKSKEAIVFSSNTTMDLTPSKGALYAGLGVCALTVALYVIFW